MTYLEKGDTNMTLSEMIEALRQEREILEIKRRSAAEAQEWLERTPEWQALCKAKQELQRVQDAVEQREQMIHDEAVRLYQSTGEKKPHPAVSIRVFREPQYDEQTMRNWLMANAPTFLKIDAARLKKSAEALPDAPLTWQDKPVAYIASDLGTER